MTAEHSRSMADKKAAHVPSAWTDSAAGETMAAWNDQDWKVFERKVKISPLCVSQQQHLCIDDYQQWFDAILGDDEEKLLQTIKSTDNWENLLQGHFHYGDGVLARKARRGPCSSVQLPLAVAAVAGATNSILTLLHAGVSPQQLDCHGNNVLHSLVAFLHYNRQLETQILSKLQLLRDTVSADVMRQILHHENALGLRPLEFAAQHGQGSMVLAILNTPGVYLMKQQVVGLTSYKCYNITEYESTGSQSRAHKSPLLLMTYAGEDCVDSLCDFVQHDLIKTWYRKKFFINLPLIVFWAMLRMTLVLMYAVVDVDMGVVASSSQNKTGKSPCVPSGAIILSESVLNALQLFLIVNASLSLCLYIIWLIITQRAFRRYLLYTLSGRKTLVLQKSLYEVSYMFLVGLMLAIVPTQYFGLGMNLDVMDYVRIAAPFMACWFCFFFVQILPGIGPFIVSIYSMMGNLVRLVIIYFLMIAPFVQSFYNFMNSNSEQGCIAGFDSFMGVVYSLFQIMLNMVNLQDYEIQNNTLMYITHMIYIFFVAVMLINFFIAVMTDSVARISRIHVAAVTIQRADMVFSVESLWSRVLGCYYRALQRRVFDHVGDELVLIHSTTEF